MTQPLQPQWPGQLVGSGRIFNEQVATIASGGTVSSIIDLREFANGSVSIPAAMTGVALTFLGSADGVTFQPVYTAANVLVSITIAPGRDYLLPADVMAWPYAELVSGTAELAARTLVVSLKS